MDWLKKKEETWKSILNSSKENISADAAELGTMQDLIVYLEKQPNKETHICEIEWLRSLDELNKKLDNAIAHYNEQSGAACIYCNDEDCATSSALNASQARKT